MDWFPNRAYANLYGVFVLTALLSDEIISRLMGGKGISFGPSRDRGSFLLIYMSSLIGFGARIYFRYHKVGLVPLWVQSLALILVMVGTVICEWAIVLLGRFFSWTIAIQQDHHLITQGVFHWIRHPAYTGMLIMDTSIILGLGTWAGALFMLVVMLAATLYRIRLEEKVLLETFGDEYRRYMEHIGRLLPLW